MLEILIVGAMITLLAGIAIFGVNEFYESGRRKAMFDETKQIGTALSFARDDIGYFPSMGLLPLSSATLTQAAEGTNLLNLAATDMYGYIGPFSALARNFKLGWKGPYMTFSEARRGLTRGTSALVSVYLPNMDRVVAWPADTWGNPYAVYLLSTDPNNASTFNTQGIRFINTPTELPNYWAAVVSYGKNGVPGGLGEEAIEALLVEDPALADAAMSEWDNLAQGSLFIEESGTALDFYGSQVPYFFVLRQVGASGNANLLSSQFQRVFPETVEIFRDDARVGQVGIRDTGSDDVFWAF